jgi:hypothetical protein
VSAPFRRPTAKQIETLRLIKHGPTPRREVVEKAIEKGWAKAEEDDWYDLALTGCGESLLADAEAIARLATIPRGPAMPNVSLRKRMYNRAWLGWEVLCYAGCSGDYFNTRHCVWATNDHETTDKWDADAAYARHVLKHLDESTPPAPTEEV